MALPSAALIHPRGSGRMPSAPRRRALASDVRPTLTTARRLAAHWVREASVGMPPAPRPERRIVRSRVPLAGRPRGCCLTSSRPPARPSTRRVDAGSERAPAPAEGGDRSACSAPRQACAALRAAGACKSAAPRHVPCSGREGFSERRPRGRTPRRRAQRAGSPGGVSAGRVGGGPVWRILSIRWSRMSTARASTSISSSRRLAISSCSSARYSRSRRHPDLAPRPLSA